MTVTNPSTLVLPQYSWYQATKIYQDASSSQLFFGPWGSITFPQALDDTWVQIRNQDGLRFDLIANQVYGTPELWWVLAVANQVSNPFTQLFGYASYARSPVIFAADARPCFYAISVEYGANYNVDNIYGLTFDTTATTLEVFSGGQSVEFFTGLSPYPLNPDGSTNTNFWGSVSSSWLRINWIATDLLQPALSGIIAPVPSVVSSYLTGGVDERVLTLRVPSLTNVMSILSAATTT